MVRLGQALLVVVFVVVLTFILQYVLPNDPARALLPRANGASLQRLRETLHLNDPLMVQFARYFGGLLRGDLGQSFAQQRSVASLIVERLPATLLLAFAAVVMQTLIGSVLGVAAAFRPKVAGKTVTSIDLVLFSTPSFTIGLLLILLFGFRLHLLPVAGGFGLPQLVLPAITLALAGVPWYAQVVREETLQSLSSPYVRTAIAKGVPDRRIIRTHVLRNISPPILTMAGLDFAALISGVAIVESVFGWPGIGQLAVSSSTSEDRPVVLGVVLVGTVAIVVFSLVIDVLQMYLDPRTRQGT